MIRENQVLNVRLAAQESHGHCIEVRYDREDKILDIGQALTLFVDREVIGVSLQHRELSWLELLQPERSVADQFLRRSIDAVGGLKLLFCHRFCQHMPRHHRHIAYRLLKWRVDLRRDNPDRIIIHFADFEILAVDPQQVDNYIHDVCVVDDIIPGKDNVVRGKRMAIAPTQPAS